MMRLILKHKLTWATIIILVIVLLGLFIFPKIKTQKTGVDLTWSAIASSVFSSGNVSTSTDIISDANLLDYIKIIQGCDYKWDGGCVNIRSGPGENFSSVAKLRNGILLKVADKVEKNGRTWYKISYDEHLRYPEKVYTDQYVASDFVQLLKLEGAQELTIKTATTPKYIIVSRDEQKLYAYDGDTLFMKTEISTGLATTPTPRGTFTVYKKTPSRYMQGPIPGISEQEFDLPGVPWDLYFTEDGAVIHGAYWHNDFGKVHSNGCVNMRPEEAEKLYSWAELGMKVVVRD